MKLETCIPQPSSHDHAYLELMRRIHLQGDYRMDRTGTGASSLFGHQLRFDLSDGTFPLLTTKKVHLRSIIHELLWFLKGETNVKYLQDNGVTIWDEWADKDGSLGKVYGGQWIAWDNTHDLRMGDLRDETSGEVVGQEVKFNSINQIKELVEGLIKNPYGRRHIVSAWNVSDIPTMKLPPCHCLFQCFVSSKGTLSLHLYQRSADYFLGVPFNIASYALLLLMLAQVTGLKPGEFVHSFGDVHLYSNHSKQVEEQLAREPFPAPRIEIGDSKDIFGFKFEDFKLLDYTCHGAIKAPIAV